MGINYHICCGQPVKVRNYEAKTTQVTCYECRKGILWEVFGVGRFCKKCGKSWLYKGEVDVNESSG